MLGKMRAINLNFYVMKNHYHELPNFERDTKLSNIGVWAMNQIIPLDLIMLYTVSFGFHPMLGLKKS